MKDIKKRTIQLNPLEQKFIKYESAHKHESISKVIAEAIDFRIPLSDYGNHIFKIVKNL